MNALSCSFVEASCPFCLARLPASEVLLASRSFLALRCCCVRTATICVSEWTRARTVFVRSRALLVLASGYLFSAIFLIPHTLTFPNVFAPEGGT